MIVISGLTTGFALACLLLAVAASWSLRREKVRRDRRRRRAWARRLARLWDGAGVRWR